MSLPISICQLSTHPLAEKLMVQEPIWVTPTLWRSELRNVLALYLRKKALTFDQAYGIQTEAETLLAEYEFEMDSYAVLHLAEISHCSAYDCEFVALAKRLDLQLVTADKRFSTLFRQPLSPWLKRLPD